MSAVAAKITPNTIAEHGLTKEEYDLILEIMGREPSMTERSASSRSCGRSIVPTSPPASI